MSFQTRDPLERFMEKVDRHHPSGCWIWTGGKQTSGYGGFWDGQRDERAHRFSFRMFCGEIPAGFHVHHVCCNPSCVNPEHLQTMTRRDNLLASDTLPGINARKTLCKRGHPLSGDNLRITNGARICKTCDAFRSREYKAKRSRPDHEPTVSAMREGGAL